MRAPGTWINPNQATATEIKEINLAGLQKILDEIGSIVPSKAIVWFSIIVPFDQIIVGKAIDMMLDCVEHEKGFLINPCNKKAIMDYVKEHSTIWSSPIVVRKPNTHKIMSIKLIKEKSNGII